MQTVITLVDYKRLDVDYRQQENTQFSRKKKGILPVTYMYVHTVRCRQANNKRHVRSCKLGWRFTFTITQHTPWLHCRRQLRVELGTITWSSQNLHKILIRLEYNSVLSLSHKSPHASGLLSSTYLDVYLLRRFDHSVQLFYRNLNTRYSNGFYT